MKNVVALAGLMALGGCGTVPPVVTTATPIQQAYYVPPGGFSDAASSQCQMTVDAQEFVKCTDAVKKAQLGTETGVSPGFGSYASAQYPTYSPQYSFSSPSGRAYTGNCPTPESIDAAGRRCGARSAASRPGGFDGYGSWARRSPSYSSGTVNVRGYYRKNGTYVRPHTRRR